MDPVDIVMWSLVAFFLATAAAGLAYGLWKSREEPVPAPAATPPAPRQPEPRQPAPQPIQRSQPQQSEHAQGETPQEEPTGQIIEQAEKTQFFRRKLEDLSVGEIRKIAADYGLAITGKVGTTLGRVLVLLAYAGIVLLLADLLVYAVTTIIGLGKSFHWVFVAALVGATMGQTYKLWLVSVPKLTGLITTNLFTGELHVFGTGFGIKYPWERYTYDDFIDVQADVVESKSRFITDEGIPVIFRWSMQFTPFMPMLPLYIRTASKAISDGLEEVVETTFSDSILGQHVDDVRKPATIDRIRENLLRMLEGAPIIMSDGTEAPPRKLLGRGGETKVEVEIGDAKGYPMQYRFGISVELGTLSPPEFDKDYQEVIIGRVTAAAMLADAKKLAAPDGAWPGLPPERAMRTIQIINKEPGVTDQGLTIDFTQNAKEAAGDLGDSLRGAAPALAALAAKNKGGGKK